MVKFLFAGGAPLQWRDHSLRPSMTRDWSRAPPASDPLDDRGGAHAGADAERGETGREVAPLHLVEQRSQYHGAGGAERMAHGDGAAIHVDLVVRHLEDLQVAQDDGGERLVQLPEIDVLDG